jgi:hypothetical protein
MKGQILLTVLLAIVLAGGAAGTVFAQGATVVGTVRDASTGEELIGVNVLVVGTAIGATTDLQGRYTIKNAPLEPFDLRFSYVGYASGKVTGVRVKPGETLKMDLNLAAETIEGEEVVVTAERQLNTESALLAVRRKAATIGDAVSMEQVKKSPDATSGDALKRITGVTIYDNKFVFVRGVTDRYNSATLNGVAVTSTDTDADKKSFAFDLIPANLLENMTVTKTATPDLPGDFTGGLVQLNTLDFPDRRTAKLSLSTSTNTITNLATVRKSQGAAQDWTGRDNGYREFPGSDKDIRFDLPRSLPNNWSLFQERAPLNGSMNLSLGDRMNMEEDVVGYIAGLSYRNGYQRTETTNDYYDTFGSRIIEGEGARDAYSVLWGGLVNLSYQFSGLHKITFNNNYSQSGEDKVTFNEFLDNNDEANLVEIAEWDERSNYVTQLTGTHNLPALGGVEVQWRGAYSSSISEEPDRRQYVRAKPVNTPPEFPYFFESAQRSWSNLREFSRSFGTDILVPVSDRLKVKFGGVVEGKSRTYDIRFFQVDSRAVNPMQNPRLLELPPDSIFAPENFAPGRFFMLELSSPRDKYAGTQELLAAYAMLDYRFGLLGEEFRFAGGARMENSEQLVNTISPFATNEPYVARVKNIDVLPSANFSWIINDVTNFRLAYSQSVNRPEFRELSSFYFYDYNTFEGTFGNPLLGRALSRNYDARFEWFPDLGDVVAMSYFSKGITNAIEVKILPSTNPERTWFNSPKGKNYGWELEVRKHLGFIGSYFRNISVGGNYSRITSEIEFEQGYKVDSSGVFVDRFRTETREMQGQSPWTLNLFLAFTEPTLGTSLSLLYNEYGERMDAVGDRREFDILERPRGILDLSVTQPVMAGLELKFTAKDITAKRKEYFTREGQLYRTTFQGKSYSLQASFSF